MQLPNYSTLVWYDRDDELIAGAGVACYGSGGKAAAAVMNSRPRAPLMPRRNTDQGHAAAVRGRRRQSSDELGDFNPSFFILQSTKIPLTSFPYTKYSS